VFIVNNHTTKRVATGGT